MKTYSADEYKKKYGEVSYSNLKSLNPGPTKEVKAIDKIKAAGKQGVDQVVQGFKDSKTTNPIEGLRASLKIGAGAVNTAFAPLAPVFEPISQGIKDVGDRVSNIPAVQKFATSKAGERTSRITEDVSNLNTIAGAVAGSKTLMKVPEYTGTTAANLGKIGSEISENIPKANGAGLIDTVSRASNGIIGTSDQIINHNVSSALDLTPGDLNTIARSTGNDVGRFMADHNLIGDDKPVTVSNLENFYKENYKNVRTEIGKVDQTFKPSQVPRYVEALKAIQSKTEKVPGLQEASVEIDNLLNKKEIKLTDVQRVKELLDKHSNIYNRTGDVGDTIVQQGLDNIRKDLKGFIEQQVKEKTGSDIGDMNNNVSTARGILDAIETRSQKGLTRSNLSLSDMGIFTSATLATGGNPLFGVAALFAKKLLQSPGIQLKIAKFIDGLSDARQAAIASDLESGKIPQEFTQFIKKKPSSTNGINGPGAKNLHLPSIEAQDQMVMKDFIDYVRLKKPTNNNLELAASRIAENYQLKMPKSVDALANEFDNYLSKYKSVYGPRLKKTF